MTDAELLNLSKNPPPRRARLRMTPEVIARIRLMRSEGFTGSELAEMFGVHRSTISQIVNRTGMFTMTDHEITAAMLMYGGAFMKALATAFRCADNDNQERLKSAFPDYWEKYRELALLRAK